MSKDKNTPILKHIQPGGKISRFDAELIKELEAHYKESGKSWNNISDEMNLSAAVVSTWRKEKYTGDIEGINETVRRYLILQRRKALSPKVELDYVETKNNRTVLKVLETAHVDGVIGAIIGDTGTSKTTSIRKYMEENNVIFISANGTYKFPVEYLRKIHTHSIVGKDGLGTMNKLCSEIINELKKKDAMIVIDQADYLNLRAIDVFRTFNDEAGIGIVFVGLPSFLSKIQGNQPEVRQVRDRIKVRVELKAFSFSDCQKIIDRNYPGINGYAKDFYEQSLGSIRILSSLIYNVKKMVAGGEKLDKATINEAAKMLERRAVI